MKVKAVFSGFVGHGGQSVWIGEGEEHDHDDAIVQANPAKFTAPEKPEPPKQRGGALRRG